MAKYCGLIGFSSSKEDESRPGVWVDDIVERRYYGDYMKNVSVQWRNGSNVNDDINASTLISIIFDPYAMKNYSFIKYAELYGTLWKVTNVEIEYPRLKLTLGGVYNGESPGSSC